MYGLERAFAEIVKERNRRVKDIEKLNHEIDGLKERIERRFEEIQTLEELVGGYDAIIKKLEGVTA